MTNILLDAYNIARSHGPGVATYGRNLARAAAGLGCEVNLMFGTRAGHSTKQPLLNEIALAEGSARRVIAFPSSSKFYSPAFPVPLCHPSDWVQFEPMARRYPDALGICRERNRAFLSAVLNSV